MHPMHDVFSCSFLKKKEKEKDKARQLGAHPNFIFYFKF